VVSLETQLEQSRPSVDLVVKAPLPGMSFRGRRITSVYTLQKLLVEYLERQIS